MKKLFLFTGILFYCVGVFAQQRTNSTVKLLKVKSSSVAITKPQLARKDIGAEVQTTPVNNAASRNSQVPATSRRVVPTSTNAIVTEAIIGTSTYDLQTNGTISNINTIPAPVR